MTDRPQLEPFRPALKAKSWGNEILVAATPFYTGKVLHRRPRGTRGGLQYHATRDETFYLHTGEAIVYFVDRDGILRYAEMQSGQSFHVPAGAIHSVQTVGESVMFEASHPVPVPELDTVVVETEYRIARARHWEPR